MRPGLWRRARLLGSASAAALAGYSVLTLFATPAAVLAGGCKTTPSADVAITQSSSTASIPPDPVTSVTFVVTGENAGPCNADGVTLTDKFSDGATTPTSTPLTVTVASVNPSSLNCTVSSQTVSCAPFKLSGPKDASTNNPGNVILTITVSGNFYASSPAPPVGSLASIAYAFDTTAGNDTSQGAFLIDGGDFGYLADKSGQSTNLHVDAGHGSSGGAEIEQGVSGPACPSGVKCFGEVVLINANDITNGGGAAVQTYTFDVPLVKGGPSSASAVVVLHEPDGSSSWVTVPACTSPPPATPDPCVVSITKIKPTGAPAFFQIVVATVINGRWTA